MMAETTITPDKKQYLIGILLLVLVSGLLYYQVTLLMAAREEERVEQKNYIQVQSQMREYIQEKENFENKQKQLALYERLLPKNPDEDELIIILKETADLSGIEMPRMHFEERVNKSGFTEMPMALSLRGQYRNLIAWMDQMSKSPRSVRIDSMTLTQEQRESGEVRAEIKANAFYTP